MSVSSGINWSSGGDTSGGSSATTDYGAAFGFTSDDAVRPLTLGNVPPPDQNNMQYRQGANGLIKQNQSTWGEYFDSIRNSVTQDPSGFKELQAKLYAGGYYKPYLNKGETPNFGRMDGNTVKALNDMINEAVVSGQSIDDTINGAKDQNAGQGKISTVRLTNPADVAANAQQAAFKTTGKPLDPGMLAQIQGNAEATAQQTYGASGDSNVYAFSPSEAWLQQQIQQLAPQATQAYSTFQGANAVQQLLGSANSPVGNLYHG